MKCRNCGAKIKADEVRCPFCSAMNERAASRRYMGKLHELHHGMEALYEQPERTLKHEIAVTVTMTLGAVLLAVLAGFVWETFTRGNSAVEILHLNERAQTEIDWKEENFPILDGLYEKQDFESLMELYDNRYDMSEQYFYEWKHFALLEALENYAELLELEAEILEEGITDSYQIRYALEAALMLLYDRKDMPDEDKWLTDELAKGTQEILEKYLKLFPEDIEEIYEAGSAEGYYISYSVLQTYAEKIYEELFAGKEGQ